MSIKYLYILVFLCCFSGCYRLTSTEIKDAYYGSYPNNYKAIIESYLSNTLKDPESAKYYYVVTPRKTYIHNLYEKKFGYGVCMYVNAKNSYGGFTGKELMFFLILDNRVIINYIEQERESTLPSSQSQCSIMAGQQEYLNEIDSFNNSNTNKFKNTNEIYKKLKKIKELKDLGILTNSEYELRRKYLADQL